jgi:hypothetical protein
MLHCIYLYVCTFIVILLYACTPVNSANALKQNKGNKIMADSNLVLQNALARCEKDDPNELDRLFADLNNENFLMSLDDITAYQQQSGLNNLEQLLRCLAEKAVLDNKVNDHFVMLSKSQLYARENNDGAMRRTVLIHTSGYVSFAADSLIRFLEEEIVKGDNFEYFASRALGRIGTNASLAVLWNKIYDPQKTVLPEIARLSVWEGYTYELGEYRDRLPVFSFLVDRLYSTHARNTVIQCITDDVIERRPEPEYHIILAPLNEKTPNGVNLANKLSHWLIIKGEELKKFYDFKAITKRVPDLLGIKPTEPASGEANEVKRWAVEQFERALKVESDSERKRQIQAALKGLK